MTEELEFVAILQGRLDSIRESHAVLTANEVDARVIPPGSSNPNT